MTAHKKTGPPALAYSNSYWRAGQDILCLSHRYRKNPRAQTKPFFNLGYSPIFWILLAVTGSFIVSNLYLIWF